MDPECIQADTKEGKSTIDFDNFGVRGLFLQKFGALLGCASLSAKRNALLGAYHWVSSFGDAGLCTTLFAKPPFLLPDGYFCLF